VSGASATHKKGEQVTGLVLHGVWARGGIDTVVNGVSATVVDVVTKGGKVISVTYDIQDQVTFDLERVAEARKKGEALGCYRLCIKKGKRRIAKF
jgi:hypothetical protein